MKYEVKTKFVFSGSFSIEAENQALAKEYVEKQCNCVLGEISAPCTEDYWVFPVHSEKIIGRIRRLI